jgi:hypothetical protein
VVPPEVVCTTANADGASPPHSDAGAPACLNADYNGARLAIAIGRREWAQNKGGRKSETGGTCEMKNSPAQGEQRTVPITYRAEIHVKREGDEEVRLDRSAKGSSIGDLVEDLVAQAAELEAEAQQKLDQSEAERDKAEQTVNQAELSGRRRRSWE